MSNVMRSLQIILIFSSISEASNWQFIRPTGAENNGFYIDMDNVKRLSKSKVRFWYTVAKSADEAKKDTYAKYYIEMDCLQKRYRDITSEREHKAQSYSGGGVSVEITTESSIVWDNISPDFFQESFYDILCRKQK
jgi:hypothetical protein